MRSEGSGEETVPNVRRGKIKEDLRMVRWYVKGYDYEHKEDPLDIRRRSLSTS